MTKFMSLLLRKLQYVESQFFKQSVPQNIISDEFMKYST